MLVVDANIALAACLAGAGLEPLRDRKLVAPPLLWSEVRSSLHEAAWRGDLSPSTARAAHERLLSTRIVARAPRALGPEAWRIADELGWAKTYDAEYVALAKLLRCRLVTVDERLRRGADRYGFVVTPDEL